MAISGSATAEQMIAPPRNQQAADVRAAIRAGSHTGHTAGFAPGRLQANLAILPASYADDFHQYCRLNPRPCPVVGKSEPGVPFIPSLGDDIDIRTDLPGYNVYRQGALESSPTDIRDLWTEEMVAFAIGCSFTFERALLDAGIRLWHIENNKTVPMYRTSVESEKVGPFGGGTVVSMRALPRHQVEQAREISARYPWAHGAPIHVGDPAEIGIADLYDPDWGDAPPQIGSDAVPMFWGCGVTPQNAIQNADVPLCITHKPGCMLITDVGEFEPVSVR
ncbi:MAG: putative hydro-lyase [Pseudomonadota bacterium]